MYNVCIEKGTGMARNWIGKEEKDCRAALGNLR